jgi:hypothetical protein
MAHENMRLSYFVFKNCRIMLPCLFGTMESQHMQLFYIICVQVLKLCWEWEAGLFILIKYERKFTLVFWLVDYGCLDTKILYI